MISVVLLGCKLFFMILRVAGQPSAARREAPSLHDTPVCRFRCGSGGCGARESRLSHIVGRSLFCCSLAETSFNYLTLACQWNHHDALATCGELPCDVVISN